MVKYFVVLNATPCRTSTSALLALSSLILEVIQGPCMGNQDHFAINTELVEVLNKQVRAEGGQDSVLAEELELKKSCIDIFQALLEGQGSKKDVYERVLAVVHIDIIYLMSSPELLQRISTDDEEVTQILLELQTESMVLLQSLINYRPSIREELGIKQDDDNFSGSKTVSVEVIWRGELQRRFFHIPDICDYFAESSKTKFVETVNRNLQENKLNDLLKASHTFYAELRHQEKLTNWGLSIILSRVNQDRSEQASFVIACIINLLQLLFYSHAGETNIHFLFFI